MRVVVVEDGNPRIIEIPQAGLQGPPGKSILWGEGPPDAELGQDDEFYLDILEADLYGPKEGAVWGGPVSLIGPEGDIGVAGKTILHGNGAPDNALGTNGDFYVDDIAHDFYGPKAAGDWPEPFSLIGPEGDIGPAWDQWQGAWSNLTEYVVNDVVRHLGSSWIALAANDDSEPAIANPDWDLVASKGDSGDLSDANPLALADVASPGDSAVAARDDHEHPRTGLATDVELTAEADARAAADITLAGAIDAEVAARAADVDAEEGARIAGDAATLGAAVAKTLLDANTIIKADANDTPVALAIAEQRLVGRVTGGSIAGLTAAQVKTLLAITTADIGAIDAALFDANTILKADDDDTPIALAVAASRIIGRKATGGIGALTAAEVKAILALTSGDISGLPQIAQGSYTGDGTSDRTISLAFTPKFVAIGDQDSTTYFLSTLNTGTRRAKIASSSNSAAGNNNNDGPLLVTNGFNVDGGASGRPNNSGATYHYFAIG